SRTPSSCGLRSGAGGGALWSSAFAPGSRAGRPHSVCRTKTPDVHRDPRTTAAQPTTETAIARPASGRGIDIVTEPGSPRSAAPAADAARREGRRTPATAEPHRATIPTEPAKPAARPGRTDSPRAARPPPDRRAGP